MSLIGNWNTEECDDENKLLNKINKLSEKDKLFFEIHDEEYILEIKDFDMTEKEVNNLIKFFNSINVEYIDNMIDNWSDNWSDDFINDW